VSARRLWTPQIEADALAIVVGLAAAQLAFAVLVWLYGESPWAMTRELFFGTWGTAYGAGQVLFKATPLFFTGLAVHVALRAGLFNVGVEGQLAVASLAVGALGAHLPPNARAAVAWPLLFAVAMGSGALWAMVPAVLRSRFGTHEVITTILMNRLAGVAVNVALGLGLAEAGSVRTPDVVYGARLPRLSALVPALRGSAVSVAAPIAVLAVLIALVLLPRTRYGREAVLVAQNPVACEAERIPVGRRLLESLLLSGAIAGLASLGTVLGYKGYYEQGLGAGAGFTGIAVAMLGRGRMLGMLVAALLFGTLAQGGLVLNAHVPMEVMEVLQAVVVLAVALGDGAVRRQVMETLRSVAVRAEATA
jgi:simple sugar transport system permease protein